MSKSSSRDLRIFATADELEQHAAAEIVRIIERAIAERGGCTLALSGGETPRRVYRRLSMDPLKSRVDWQLVHVFFGDERAVPPGNPLSNFGMVRWELISRVPIPRENVHRIRGEEDTDLAAKEYERELARIFGDQGPGFDLVLLGLGVDGHTASLFPESQAIDEQRAFVCSVFVPSLNSWRVTLTLPSINAARVVLFLVTGAQKSAILRAVLDAPFPDKSLPATMVSLQKGSVLWLVDKEAASRLGDVP